MLKQYLIVILAVLVVNLSFGGRALAETTKETKAAKHAAKVKSKIAKLGAGSEAKIKVTLKDGTKLRGYVSEINETSFVVTNEVTGVATEVPYPNARQVRGNNLSTGAKIAIGAAIIIGAMLLFCALSPDCPD